MSEIDNNLIIEPTVIYGTVSDSINYDIYKMLGKELLHNRLTKIKCFLKSNSIYGIQFTYKDKRDAKETIVDINSKEKDLIEQEMDLNDDEEIIDFKLWIDYDVKLVGFEITTSKERKVKFGFGNDDDELRCVELLNRDKIILGFGCFADDKEGVTAIYAYFINKKE